jgi:carboxypeptidase T
MPYLNIDEVETALEVATSAPYNTFTELITLPNLSWEGRQCHAIKIASVNQRTEKAMHDMNLREDTDRGMPRIDALNWVLNEILVLKREDE